MAVPFKSDTIVIPSGGAADPRVVTGTSDPTGGVSAPEGSIYLRYVASNGQAFVKSGPGDTDWTDLVTAGGTTLDGSYDFGGLGAGRIIVADSGAVQINATTTNVQPALVLDRSPAGSAAAVGLEVTLGSNANTSSNGIQLNDSGTGTSLYTTKLAAGIAHYTSLQHAGAQALVIAVNAAPTSSSPVAINANTDGTTATLLSITKIPSAATAGAGIGISMGGNTTGPAITISAAGTGPALQVSAGAIEMANSAAAVSPVNNGRLRYNSGTQTFQVSMNGAAYVDITTGASFTLDIGDTIGGSTVGSVLFVGAGGVLQQDNANLNWNDTNNALTVTTTTTSAAVLAINSDAGAGAMAIRNTNISGPVDFYAVDSAGTARMSWGYGNPSYGDAARAGRGYVWRNGVNFVFARTSVVDGIIDTAGRFGIGTLTSLDTNSLLHVNQGASGAAVSIGNSLVTLERSAAVYLTLKGPAASDKGVLFNNPSGGADGGVIYDNAGLARGLQFRTGGNTTRVQISSTGLTAFGTHTPLYTVDVGNAGASQIHISNGGVDSGGYLTSTIANQLYLSGGIAFNGTNLIAKATSASVVEMTTGAISFQTATGLTIGAISAMNERMNISTTGVVTIAGVAATNSLILSTGNVLVSNGQTQLTRNHATDGPLFVFNNNVSNTGPSAIGFLNQAASFRSYLGYFPSAYAFTHLQLLNGWLAQSGEDIAFANATENAFRFGMTTNSAFLGMSNGGSAAVSASSTGRIRYNSTSQRFQVSENGGSYLFVGTWAATPITGGVLFGNGSDRIAQDSANFFWDDTNNRLGIGTATPATTLHVFGAGMVNALGTTQPTFETDLTAQFTVAQSSGNWGLAVARASGADIAGAHLTLFKTRATDPSTKTALVDGDTLGDIMFMGVDAANAVQRTAAIAAIVNGAVGAGSVPTDLRFDTGVAGPPTERFRITSTGEVRIASLTLGSVLFAGASGAVSQDNANLFWDDTSNRLGIGNAAPATTLHVTGNSYVDGKAGVGIDPTSGTTTLSAFRGTTGDTQQIWNVINGVDASTVDTTAALAFRTAVRASSQASRSAGANDLYNIGLYANATNGQNNWAIATEEGDVMLNVTSGITVIGPTAGTGGVLAMNGGSAVAVSAADTGRIRYDESVDRFQASVNGGAYADFKFTTTEYLSADGAADPAIETSFVSGTGTDLTLANGTRGGFIKNFVITGGSGTITPANLADGNVLTWSATPANVSFIWDATNTTWHVIGNPYNMVTT